MYSFQECLKEYFEVNTISYSNAEKLCGINRTVLSRYIKGTRIPQNEEIVDKIATGLDMNKEERKRISDAYSRVRICKEFFINYSTVKKVLDINVIKTKENTDVNENRADISENTTKNLESREKILEVFCYMMKDAEFLKIMANPEYPEMQNIILKMIGQMQQKSTVEQIIALDSLKWQQCEMKIERVSVLLPMLLQKENSNIYYYMDRCQLEEGNGRQNYIITDKGVLLFNHTLSKGLFSNQNIPHGYLKHRFDYIKKQINIYAMGGEQQYKNWCNTKMEREYVNKKTDIFFGCSQEANDIWIVCEKEKRAVCVKESGIVHFLKRFLWE